MIEMPRALINLEQTLKNPVNNQMQSVNKPIIENSIINTNKIIEDDHNLFYNKYIEEFPEELQNKVKALYDQMDVIYNDNSDMFDIEVGANAFSLTDLSDNLLELMQEYPDYYEQLNNLDELHCPPF
jgi:hypothetical protein